MKISRKFILVCILLILFVFFIQMQLPRRFHWQETYNINSSEPFGTYLFDSLLVSMTDGNYDFENGDLDIYLKQRLRKDSVIHENLLLIDRYHSFSQLTDSLLYHYALRGGNVLIVGNHIAADDYGTTIEEDKKNNVSVIVEDSLDESDDVVYDDEGTTTEPEPLHFFFARDFEDAMRSRYYSFDLMTARKLMGLGIVEFTDTLRANSRYPATTVKLITSLAASSFFTEVLQLHGLHPLDCYPASAISPFTSQQLGVSYPETDSLSVNPLSTAATMSAGKGSITVSLVPQYFTNFGILSPNGRTYTLRLLNRVTDKRLVRVLLQGQSQGNHPEGYGDNAFTFFLDRPPLAMALRLGVVGCLLALFVNARRRQRAIAPVGKEHNVTLHFLRQVALLYRPGDDYSALLQKRFISFAERVRNRVGADVADFDPKARQEAARLLALHTGETYEATHDALRDIHFRMAHEGALSQRDFKACVDVMNRIQRLL